MGPPRLSIPTGRGTAFKPPTVWVRLPGEALAPTEPGRHCEGSGRTGPERWQLHRDLADRQSAYGRIAQWLEHPPVERKVTGSSPVVVARSMPRGPGIEVAGCRVIGNPPALGAGHYASSNLAFPTVSGVAQQPGPAGHSTPWLDGHPVLGGDCLRDWMAWTHQVQVPRGQDPAGSPRTWSSGSSN